MKVRHALEAAGFRLLLTAARVLPRRAMLAAGSAAGLLGWALDGRHRRIAAENLERALGATLDTAARARLQRACWRHFGRITLEQRGRANHGRQSSVSVTLSHTLQSMIRD